MIKQELQNFMDKVSCDITKIMQACTVVQENTGKLIENPISHALNKPQDVTPPNPHIDFRNFWNKPCIIFFLGNKLDLILANKNVWHIKTL